MIRCAREERCTDSHSYENKWHVFHAFTDVKCEIPDQLLCVCQRGDTRGLWHVKAPQLQLQNEGTAKKMPSRETVG